MSKRELKKLEKELEQYLSLNGVTQEFYIHHEVLKPHLDELGRGIAERHNEANQKDFDWMKWLILIASGVFSVIVSQLTSLTSVKNSALFIDHTQLIWFKTAISANAIGIILGAIYLYMDVMTERDLARKLGVQRLHLLLRGENKYDTVIPASRFTLFRASKFLSLLSFLIAITSWVIFIWGI